MKTLKTATCSSTAFFWRPAGGRVWADRVSRWLLAAIFAAAMIPKLAEPQLFADNIGDYGLLPDILLQPAAWSLMAMELAAVVGLLLGRGWGVVLTGILLTLFISVLGYGMYLGLDIDCGCFAQGESEHTTLSGLRGALIRDLGMMVLLIYPCWYRFFGNVRCNS